MMRRSTCVISSGEARDSWCESSADVVSVRWL